ncbi:MAG: protein kinase [Cyanobacteria bacterium J06623_7]
MDNNLVGQTIQGRYYVVRQLGRGGVGVTFLAQDQQCFDRQCVVKQLKPKTDNAQAQAIARRLFNREAEIMNRLGDCDRIPRLLAYFEQDNDFFLVQELIEGHDLSQEIISGKPWSESKTLTLLQDVLEVLLIVQQHSVIHRDIKPSNLMRRTADSKIVLIDFGSVKQVSTQIIDAAGQVKQTVAVGTKSYMPMEQMMGRPGFYSDIYALGMIAIQALTGVRPKELMIDDEGEVLWRNRLNRKIHYQPRFLDILDRMVRYRHQERYTSAGIVLSDLKQLDAAENNNNDTVIVAKKESSAPAKSTDAPESPVKPIESAATVEKNTKSAPVGATLITSRPQSHQQPIKSSGAKPHRFKSKLAIPLAAGVLTLAAVIGGWIMFQPQEDESEVELLQYENLDRGFRINYPPAWSRQNRDDFFASGVVFFSPAVNNADSFKERVSVLVENLTDGQSLSEYTEQSVAEIKQLSDPDIEAALPITLGVDEGRQIIYQGEENGSPVRRMQSWTLKGDRVYIITYTAKPEDYDTYLPTVDEMIESFQTIE